MLAIWTSVAAPQWPNRGIAVFRGWSLEQPLIMRTAWYVFQVSKTASVASNCHSEHERKLSWIRSSVTGDNAKAADHIHWQDRGNTSVPSSRDMTPVLTTQSQDARHGRARAQLFAVELRSHRESKAFEDAGSTLSLDASDDHAIRGLEDLRDRGSSCDAASLVKLNDARHGRARAQLFAVELRSHRESKAFEDAGVFQPSHAGCTKDRSRWPRSSM
nr:hypothetical protein CFP56_25913 [Quercus suber]